LCVDLDGTLLKSDVLYESLLALVRRNPFVLLQLPWWLLRGKAAVKHEIAMRTDLDIAALPYDERVLAMLRDTAARPRVLCTATSVDSITPATVRSTCTSGRWPDPPGSSMAPAGWSAARSGSPGSAATCHPSAVC
jgi:hypothetical protein